MKVIPLISICLIFSLNTMVSKAQNIGLRAGIPYHTQFNNHTGNLGLNSSVIDKWTVGFSYHFGLMNNLFVGLDFSVVKGSYGTNFPEIMNSSFSGGPNLLSYQFGPVMRKEIPVTEKFGFQASLGILGYYLNSEGYVYENDKSLQTIVVSDTDENGNPITRPRYDIVINGEDRIENRFNLMIRPELGMFLQTGQRGKITLDAMYGINLFSPVMERDLKEVNFEGQIFSSGNQFSGNYLALLLGFQYRIN